MSILEEESQFLARQNSNEDSQMIQLQDQYDNQVSQTSSTQPQNTLGVDYQINWDQQQQQQDFESQKVNKKPSSSQDLQYSNNTGTNKQQEKSGLIKKLLLFLLMVVIFCKIAASGFKNSQDYLNKKHVCLNNGNNNAKLETFEFSDDEQDEDDDNQFQEDSEINKEQNQQKESNKTISNNLVQQQCKGDKFMYDYYCVEQCPNHFSPDSEENICKRKKYSHNIHTYKQKDFTYQLITPQNFQKYKKENYNLVVLFHGYNANFNFFQTNTKIPKFASDYETIFLSYGIREDEFINFDKIEKNLKEIQKEEEFEKYNAIGVVGYDLGGYISLHFSLSQQFKFQFSYNVSPVILAKNAKPQDQCYFEKGDHIDKYKLQNLSDKLQNYKSSNRLILVIYGGDQDPCINQWNNFIEKAQNNHHQNKIQTKLILEKQKDHMLEDQSNILNNNLLEGLGLYLNMQKRSNEFTRI